MPDEEAVNPVHLDGVPEERRNTKFLHRLRGEMEKVLEKDATEKKKVSLSDYLKLMTFLEERRQEEEEEIREIVVRWQEPEGMGELST